jgi:hypothetical protein
MRPLKIGDRGTACVYSSFSGFVTKINEEPTFFPEITALLISSYTGVSNRSNELFYLRIHVLSANIFENEE